MADDRGSRGYNRNNDYDKGDGKFKIKRPKRKACPLCVDKMTYLDYKDTAKVRKFISEKGKILPRRISGSCAKHQRTITLAVKRARHIALLPFISE